MICQKCWNDAYTRSRIDGRPQVEHYQELLKERDKNPCSKKDQAGDQGKDDRVFESFKIG